MQDQEEAAWIEQAQTGNRNAFAELVKRYWGRIFRWLHGVRGCAHSAEDLTQEVFVKAWIALPAYREGNFRAWLFRIARNCMIDRRRSDAHRATDTLPAELPSTTAGPLDQLIAKETQRLIDEACRKLPELIRSAFLLWVQEEMSYAEIAFTLEITEVTARWRVYRARRLLLRMLSTRQDPKNP